MIKQSSMLQPDDVTVVGGIDEAGRGPLAGPVIAAVVVLNRDDPIDDLADSKKLSPKTRSNLAADIVKRAQGWAIGRADASTIDSVNILQATLIAMKRAYGRLAMKLDVAYIDGIWAPDLDCRTVTVIRGDSKVPEISAASILAKVCRDQEMEKLGAVYPQYGFERHKGYGTREHLLALHRFGPCAIHRTSFAPVKRELEHRKLELK